MIIKNNYNLKNNNTFHISSIVENFYIPQSEEELFELMSRIGNNYYVLSGGSNILLNDEKKYESIIYMKDVNDKINYLGDGVFFVGCSNRIQKVINYINKKGYGGIEKLFTLPAMFGGIIYMNAGIGSYNNSLFTISDFIEEVKIINKKDLSISWIKKEQCFFGHRKSIFQNNEYIILGAKCKFIKQDIDYSKKVIKERIHYFNSTQDFGKGTFGSTFSIANNKLLKIVSFFHKKRGNARFGKNNKNWIVNDGVASYRDTLYLIEKCKKIHRIFRKKCEVEVIIW